ncbi:hypothetical protein Tco_0378303 [Tanacetum coccineum]
MQTRFLLTDRRAILDAMVWRHPDAAIDDPRPIAGSFNMTDVRRLSAHVIKLRDMLEGVLVLSRLSRVWKRRVCDSVLRGADGNVMGIHDFLCLLEWTGVEIQEEPHLDVRPTLQRLPFYCTPPVTADAVILDPASEDLTVGTPSSKIVAKVEASQKQNASTFGSASSLSDGDDDGCVEIPLVTPVHSTAMIPSLGNQGRSSTAPAAEGSNTRDSRGKGVMVDDAAEPSVGASRPRPSFGPASSFRDEVFKDPTICKTIVDRFPTPREMVRVESLSDDQLTAKMSVLHCMTMSHGGELFARYRGLNQSHHEYVLSTESRLKGYEEKSKAKGKERKKKIKSLNKSLDNLHVEVARLSAALNQATILEAERDGEILLLKATPPEFSSFFQGQFQGLVRKFLASDEFSRVQGELLSLAASAVFERGLSMHRTNDEFADVLKKMISEHAAEPLSVILQLKPEKLVRPANVHIPRDTRVSPPIAKELTVTPVSKSLELSANVIPVSSAVASDQNEEQVNAVVDGSDLKMADGVASSKSGGAFVQGVSRILDDVVEVMAVESKRVSSVPTDVVVALSVCGKGYVLIPSSVAGEEAAVNSSGV